MRQKLFEYGIGWPPNRRIALGAVGLACLLAIAATTAIFTTRTADNNMPASTPPPVQTSTPQPTGPSAASSPVAGPPRISDPVAFAKASAEMLWTYDTRTTNHDQQLTGMEAWMTQEVAYSDWASVSAQMPDALLWSRMADQKQHASATAAEAHYPAAFKQALADNPSKITKAYIYAVTVTGKQTITWAGAGSGAEDRSITLAVQCRPSADCSLVAIAPNVAP